MNRGNKVSAGVRWALTLALIGMAWHSGEIGPWTAGILFLLAAENELAAFVFKREGARISNFHAVPDRAA